MSERTLIFHPQAKALLDSLPPSTRTASISATREREREICLANSGPPKPVAQVEEALLGGVHGRVYTPEPASGAGLVWMHGGGWVVGDLDCCDAVARALATGANCTVVSVDYRLAPEHPYPAAVNDCWEAVCWAAARFDSVAVGGDSSGGNLAAAVALRARDTGLRLAAQLLVYPVVDYAAVEGSSYRKFDTAYERVHGVPLSEGIRWIWETYVPNPARRTEQDASPMQAISLAGVAPATIVIAEHDILREEVVAYARRLESEGVRVELHDYRGQAHGFFALLGATDDARDAVTKAATGLRSAFEREMDQSHAQEHREA